MLRALLETSKALKEQLDRIEAKQNARKVYTIREFAGVIGYSESYVRKLLLKGELGGVKDGKKVLIPEDAKVAFMTSRGLA